MTNHLVNPVGEVHQGRHPAEVGASEGGPHYYDVPMLKKPVWSWEVAAYFFLGGVSSGAFLLSRAAARHADKLEPVVRAGTFVAAAAMIPCPPLLVLDLGDRRRFHHMLRVFKPHSPMNLGSWVLTGYGGVVALATLRQLMRQREQEALPADPTALIEADVDRWSQPRPLRKRAGDAIETGLGVPLALLMGTYTGVLLSCTATPVWTQNAWLPAVFASGAFHNGTSAVSLALELDGRVHPRIHEALDRIDAAGAAVEGAALAGYLVSASPFATPMTRGRLGPVFWGGAIGVGLVLPILLKGVGRLMGEPPRWLRTGAHAASLAGGMALRWAALRSGAISAADPEAARQASRPT